MVKPFTRYSTRAARGPLRELGAAVATDAVPNSEDGLKPVVVDLSGDLARSLGSNYPEFPDSCFATQLAFVEDVDQVFVDRSDVRLEQAGDEGLGQPDRFILEPALDAGAAVLGLAEDDAGARRLVLRRCHLYS